MPAERRVHCCFLEHRYLKELRTQLEATAHAQKRGADGDVADGQPGSKRPRGRPKGSKNSKTKAKAGAAATPPVAGGASNPT